MSEKIDLAEIEEDAREHWVMRRDDTLALVRAVRAAIRVRDCPWDEAPDATMAFKAALAPFTDSSDSAEGK